MAERMRIDIRKEMASFDQHVRRNGQQFAGTRRKQCAIVTNAKRAVVGLVTRRFGTARKKTVDQRELGEHHGVPCTEKRLTARIVR
jgi:hypothetical protein